jgi:hypothetical protein
MMKETECRAWWNEHYPDSPPVGFLLRQTYPERWLRIHSLPESKRYAETEAEYSELILRQNAVATETLGEGSSCYLIRGFWVESNEYQDGWIINLEGSEQPLRFEVTEIIWNRSRYDDLLRDVADDRVENVVFVSCESQEIYAPYDGGADLIFRNMQERDEKKRAYQAWLSTHPAGL